MPEMTAVGVACAVLGECVVCIAPVTIVHRDLDRGTLAFHRTTRVK